jgi:hypothetical protein
MTLLRMGPFGMKLCSAYYAFNNSTVGGEVCKIKLKVKITMVRETQSSVKLLN